uniref:Putative plant transposon protein domain-containing protein n=1 Tax=Solanum tuberosum TaxID=4113 RepID=M1DNS8_SOLTU
MARKEWVECQNEEKYLVDEYVNEVRLQAKFLHIHEIVCDLGLRYIFENQGDCNLTLVGEFYVNWITETRYNKSVPIHGKTVRFTSKVLNVFLGTPQCDADDYNRLKETPPYRDIRHTLCGVDSTARWDQSKDTGRHATLHYANLNQVARVWLKIVCSVLLLGKHTSDVTKEQVVLVYMLMKDVTDGRDDNDEA